MGFSLLSKVTERNHLWGKDGDRLNAILSGGWDFNLRKLSRAFFLSFSQRLFGRYLDHLTGFIGRNMSEINPEMKSSNAFGKK